MGFFSNFIIIFVSISVPDSLLSPFCHIWQCMLISHLICITTKKKEKKKGCICYAHVIMAILNHYAKLSGIGF